MAYHRGLIDNPDYQRGYVWTLEDKQKLIQSIFNRADIGKFVFIEDENYREYRLEVIDGKQRLRAILDYYEAVSNSMARRTTNFHGRTSMRSATS